MPSIAGFMRAISRDGYEVYQLKLKQEISKRVKETYTTGAESARLKQHQQAVASYVDREYPNATEEFRHAKRHKMVKNFIHANYVAHAEHTVEIGKWNKFKMWWQSLPPFSYHTADSYQAEVKNRKTLLNTPVAERADILRGIPKGHISTVVTVPLLLADEKNGLAEAEGLSITEYNGRLIKQVSDYRHFEKTTKNMAHLIMHSNFKDSDETLAQWEKRNISTVAGEIKQLHVFKEGADQPLIVEPSVNRAPWIKPERKLGQPKEEHSSNIAVLDEKAGMDHVDFPVDVVLPPPKNFEEEVAQLRLKADLRAELKDIRSMKSLVKVIPDIGRLEDPAVRIRKNASVPANAINGRDTTGKTTYVDEQGAYILYGKGKHDVVKMYLLDEEKIPKNVVLPPPVSYLDHVEPQGSRNDLEESAGDLEASYEVMPPELPVRRKNPIAGMVQVEAVVEQADQPLPPEPIEESDSVFEEAGTNSLSDPVDDVISTLDITEEFVQEFMEGVDSGQVWTNHLIGLRAELIAQGKEKARSVALTPANEQAILAEAKEQYFDLKALLQLHQLQEDQEAYAQTLTKFYVAEGFYNTMRERLYHLEPVSFSKRIKDLCQKEDIAVSFYSPEMVRAVQHQRHNLLVHGKHMDHVETFSVAKDLQAVRMTSMQLTAAMEFDQDGDQKIIFDAMNAELDRTKNVIKKIQKMKDELLSNDRTYDTLQRVDDKSRDKMILRWQQDLALLTTYEAHLVGSLMGFSQSK